MGKHDLDAHPHSFCPHPLYPFAHNAKENPPHDPD